MSTNANKQNSCGVALTPAQLSLVEFVNHLEAGDIYRHLHTTLSLSICKTEAPTKNTLEGWYFTLELLKYVHAIAVEEQQMVQE
jgi:hypothetical protein